MRRLLVLAGVILGLLASPAGSPAQETKPGTTKKETSSTKKKKPAASKSSKSSSSKSQASKSSGAKKKSPAATEIKKPKAEAAGMEVAPPQRQAPAPTDEVVGKTKGGRAVYAGPRGGHYYLNDNGDKVYVEEWEGAKIIGATEDGRRIYEGPNGGQYYYSTTGNKTYLPKEKKLK